jgi:signal transduction histidine kinase
MKNNRDRQWVFGLLLGAWLLVVAWQAYEHQRVVEAAKSDLRHRAHEIAGTLNAVTRALQFRGATPQDRLEPLLDELVNNRTNEFVNSSRLILIGLLNTNGEPIVAVGDTNLLSREILAERELWSDDYVTFIWPVNAASVSPEGVTNNPTFVLPPRPRDFTNNPARAREFPRREPRPDELNSTNAGDFSTTNFPAPRNALGEIQTPPPPSESDRSRGNRRPPWMREMSDADFKALVAKRELHGLVLAMSTENYRSVCVDDLWLRCIIGFFAAISALGAAFAWRTISKTADLQIRLVRASEQNSHLKELNLAAAGLAHETRNPLNIIRGMAQMISRQPDAPAELREKSKTILDETDKVTAQLTEFINYSRPREVRRTKVFLTAAANEVIRTLGYDLDTKKIRAEVGGENLAVEADEQLLRQVLFNLILNAIQALAENGKIQIQVSRAGASEATLEIRDDGPGVRRENLSEIFKPYFTTHQKGTGLGLAVVQQIIHAHGWEIICLANEPRGAIFRITHLKIAA